MLMKPRAVPPGVCVVVTVAPAPPPVKRLLVTDICATFVPASVPTNSTTMLPALTVTTTSLALAVKACAASAAATLAAVTLMSALAAMAAVFTPFRFKRNVPPVAPARLIVCSSLMPVVISVVV